MSDNMQLYNQGRNVPAEALKEIKGGRLNGFSDINPMWRMKRLTEMFGPVGFGWKYTIVNQRLEQGNGVEVVAFVDINLYVKYNGEWSEPIPGIGGSSFTTQERNGVHTSDECFKMALTDAIGVACKALGIAADVYFAKDRSKYDNYEPQQERSQGSYSNSNNTSTNNTNHRSESPQQANTTVKTEEVKRPSDGQKRRIFAIASSRGINTEGVKQIMIDKFQIESTKDLDLEQYKKLIDYLETA